MLRILKAVRLNSNATSFRSPVTEVHLKECTPQNAHSAKAEAPDYREKIEKPMDLQTLQANVLSGDFTA